MNEQQSAPKLTNKQRVFLEHYLTCWNATEAARVAGYADPNAQGNRLLLNVGIATAIKQRLTEKAMAADEVLARLASHARADMADFVNFRPAVKLTKIAQDGDNEDDDTTSDDDDVEQFLVPVLDLQKARDIGRLHLVKKFKEGKYGAEIELHDAQAALVHLGKHLGLFVDRVEHSGAVGVLNGDELAKAREDAAERERKIRSGEA